MNSVTGSNKGSIRLNRINSVTGSKPQPDQNRNRNELPIHRPDGLGTRLSSAAVDRLTTPPPERNQDRKFNNLEGVLHHISQPTYLCDRDRNVVYWFGLPCLNERSRPYKESQSDYLT